MPQSIYEYPTFCSIFRTPLCQIAPQSLGQFGIYNLSINSDGCDFAVAMSPVNVNMCEMNAARCGIFGIKSNEKEILFN